MLPAFAQVTTQRLLLRPIRESDTEPLYVLRRDPETSRFSVSGPLTSLEQARDLVARWLADWARDGVGYWAVELRDSPGALVGYGGVRRRELEGQTVLNLAYRFLPEVWGRGYATETARTALALSREHLPEFPVTALIHPENTRSLRIARKLGMKRDRVMMYEGMLAAVYVLAPESESRSG